ncbi:hypothetical protein ACWV95_11520 [Streptomyces albus]
MLRETRSATPPAWPGPSSPSPICRAPPLRLPLGSDALAGIENARNGQLEELRRFADLSASTDHTKVN